MNDLNKRTQAAVRHFWLTRTKQDQNQGQKSGQRDQGARSAVTGGKQMDGFVNLVSDELTNAGIPKSSIYTKKKIELPGYFRPEKKWDLIVVHQDELIIALEFKSHIGPSFGNNFNNRTEEALGNASDLWTAYREGAFAPSARPRLGYLMLLEDSEKSTRPVANREPHYKVFDEFQSASYTKRYEILLTKLVRERLYDAACLLTSPATAARTGRYQEPNPEINIRIFIKSLSTRARTAIS